MITVIYLCIIALDKICHTVRMILFANTCLTGLVCGITIFASTVFTLCNDLKQIQYQDSMCIVRGYLVYVSPALHAYSYVLATIYQYMLVVHPTRLFWNSARTQIILIIIGWILAFAFIIPFLFTGDIVYDFNNQICEIPLRLSFPVFYIPLVVFVIPITVVMVFYFKLVRYVKEMGKNLTPAATLLRAQRDLTMVRRIVILLQILLTAGCPMTVFYVLSFFNHAPKYHTRIGYFFVGISLLCVMIVSFQFTDLLKASVKKIICGRRTRVVPMFAGRSTALEMKIVETLN